MIRINLLPEQYRPVKKSILPYFLAMVICVLGILSIIFFYLSLHQKVIQVETQKSKLQKEYDSPTELRNEDGEFITLSGVVNEYRKLDKKKQELEKRVAVIQEILSDRIIWSENLFLLATLTPENVWYDRIRVTWQTFREKVIKIDQKTGKAVIDPKTKEPQFEQKSVKKPILEITGYVISGEQGERQISPLIENTTDPEKASYFVKQFTLLRPKIEDTEFNGFSVRKFTLEYLIEAKPGVKND
ncbi:MAG: PilN domain-containing protein [Candidatus Hydrogenedens sp.]